MERLIDKLNSFEIMAYIISTTLSSFGPGTWFKNSEGDLRDMLTDLYIGSSHSLIKKNLFNGFTSPFEKEEQVRKLCNYNMARLNLSAPFRYGKHMGLSNWGSDYDFQISEGEDSQKRRERVVEEARGVLGKKDFDYFRELGKELKKD